MKHHPTLSSTGRHGCWATCPCGWTSGLWTTTTGAHLEFGQHLVDVAYPTAVERLAAMQAAGHVRLCRQSKPITEAEAQIVLDFADQLRERGRARPTTEETP